MLYCQNVLMKWPRLVSKGKKLHNSEILQTQSLKIKQFIDPIVWIYIASKIWKFIFSVHKLNYPVKE